MADEPNPNPAPATTEPMGNDPTTRNPDGSIKDTQTTSEPKLDSTKQPELKAEPKPSDTKVPDKYEAFKAPEGYSLDEKLIGEATPIFKELGLDQASAQKLVDFYSKISIEAADAPFKAYEDTRNSWRSEVIKDSTLGNGSDGLKPEVQARIGRLIDSMPQPIGSAFKEAMALTGGGDNPAIIRALNFLGEALGEGTLITGRGPSPGGQTRPGVPRSAAQALFPNLPSSSGS